ncbi:MULTISPECIES: hypothetical protein [unclassified Mesorhizobium]|nr:MULTISPECIES: hypothetical protein [unclassified Mesorhizobium]
MTASDGSIYHFTLKPTEPPKEWLLPKSFRLERASSSPWTA